MSNIFTHRVSAPSLVALSFALLGGCTAPNGREPSQTPAQTTPSDTAPGATPTAEGTPGATATQGGTPTPTPTPTAPNPTPPDATAFPSDASSESSLPGCTDGIDNDGDGFTDCLDWSCYREANGASAQAQAYCFALQEATGVECGDGVDNDGDGFIDCNDWSCTQEENGATVEALVHCGVIDGPPTPTQVPTPTTVPQPESSATSCDDGVDNDHDGYTDCEDFSCTDPNRGATQGSMEVCGVWSTPWPSIDPSSCISGDLACPPGCLNTPDSDCATWRCGEGYAAEGSEFDDLSNLSNAALEAALKSRIDNHQSYSYEAARNLMYGVTADIDVRPDGVIECIYTGETAKPNGTRSPGNISTEHSWPKSDGAEGVPEESDIHHLFPATNESNNARASYEYGETDCGTLGHNSCSFSKAGSQQGPSTIDGYPIFEVRGDFRGDVARAHFYFATRYSRSIDPEEEVVLRKWHCEDPPDARERVRNDDIETYQHNRNPFVDRPDYVEQIDNF